MIPLNINTCLWWRLIVHRTYCFCLRDWCTTLLTLAELAQRFAPVVQIACTTELTARVRCTHVVAESGPIDCEADGTRDVKHRSSSFLLQVQTGCR